MGMLHFIDVKRINESSKAQYYFTKALIGGFLDCQPFLNYITHDKSIETEVFEKVLEWHEKNSGQHNIIITYNIGYLYKEGLGTVPDSSKSIQYYRLAADKGHSDAQNQLGLMFEKGDGVEQNCTAAIEWYTIAANQSNAVASYNLGRIYYYGQGVEKDYKLAFQYFRSAADQGDSSAQTLLGVMYANSHGVEQNYTTAIEWYTKAAKQNNADAHFNLGNIYYLGQGVENYYSLAFQHYQTAVNLGLSAALYQLGVCYTLGYGTEVNYEMGIIIFSKISQVYDEPIAFLGSIYHTSYKRYRNFSKAIECYKKAAGANTSFSLRGIGLLYEHGDGVKQSYEKALYYYKQSADRKNKGAYYNVGLLYYYGKGVDKNFNTALGWFNRVMDGEPQEGITYVSVEIENIDVSIQPGTMQKKYSMISEHHIYGKNQYYLGLMYREGQGTDKSNEISLDYFKRAYSNNVEKARRYPDLE